MTHELTIQPNGMKVVTVPLSGRRSVSVGIWVHAGGRDETPKLNGVSHFLEHLVFKGTSSRSAAKIKEAMEGKGGSLNAFTSEEYTCFLAKASSRHFQGVFDVLADMVLNATLKEEDIEKERTVVMEEIKMTQDQPAQLVEELLTEEMWPRHPLGKPLAGTLESVSGLTCEEIRGYRDRHYFPGLITLAGAGDLDHSSFLQMSETYFNGVRNKAPKTLEVFTAENSKPKLRVADKKTEQVHLALGVHAFSKEHTDEYVLDILSVLLGGNMSSRLFSEVREERGLAYDIGSSVRKYHDTGAFIVSAGVDAKKIVDAVALIVKELEKIAETPPKEDELERSKEFYLGQMDLSLENGMNNMLWAGESAVTLGRCRTPEETIRRVEAVTAASLSRVARELFKAHPAYLTIVGPGIGNAERRSLENLLSFSIR